MINSGVNASQQSQSSLSLPLLISFLETPAADLFSTPYKRKSTHNYIFPGDTDIAGKPRQTSLEWNACPSTNTLQNELMWISPLKDVTITSENVQKMAEKAKKCKQAKKTNKKPWIYWPMYFFIQKKYCSKKENI